MQTAIKSDADLATKASVALSIELTQPVTVVSLDPQLRRGESAPQSKSLIHGVAEQRLVEKRGVPPEDMVMLRASLADDFSGAGLRAIESGFPLTARRVVVGDTPVRLASIGDVREFILVRERGGMHASSLVFGSLFHEPEAHRLDPVFDAIPVPASISLVRQEDGSAVLQLLFDALLDQVGYINSESRGDLVEADELARNPGSKKGLLMT